jgi:hypothetical protein
MLRDTQASRGLGFFPSSLFAQPRTLVRVEHAHSTKLTGRMASQELDEEGAGVVAMGVVVEALESLLLRVDADDVMDMLKEVNLDDKPHLTLDEFATLMESGCPGGFLTWWNRLLRRKAMREVFCLIDCDGSGACETWCGSCARPHSPVAPVGVHPYGCGGGEGLTTFETQLHPNEWLACAEWQRAWAVWQCGSMAVHQLSFQASAAGSCDECRLTRAGCDVFPSGRKRRLQLRLRARTHSPEWPSFAHLSNITKGGGRAARTEGSHGSHVVHH